MFTGWKQLLLVLTVIDSTVNTVSALHAYGHAYGVRPTDFTPQEYIAIAKSFDVFTVEKDHAASIYGNKSAAKPFLTNSIAASRGSARKIKAINPKVKVLMYWNAALHFNFYECESEVKPAWVMKKDGKAVSFYNYSVPAFRSWWVKCAVDAVSGSDGVLDGLFFDATPKVAAQDGGNDSSTTMLEQQPTSVQPHLLWNNMDEWGEMVDEVRKALGPTAPLIDNGFYMQKNGNTLAGDNAWEHTGLSYTESMSSVGSATSTPAEGVELLLWVANVSHAHPDRTLIGHGSLDLPVQPAGHGTNGRAFTFGLAKYLLVTSSVANGWFLANTNYSITGGVLAQPMAVYGENGVRCGEPVEVVQQVAKYTLKRQFQHGVVTVDVEAASATIECTSPHTQPQPHEQDIGEEAEPHEQDIGEEAEPHEQDIGEEAEPHEQDNGEEADSRPVPVLPVKADEVWKCKVCGHVYNASADGKGTTFEDLPASWVCPVCGAPKSSYNKQMTTDGQVVWSHD